MTMRGILARQPSEWYGKKWHIADNGEFVVDGGE